ncbi:DNA repair protein complementing XP-A cells homolog [Gryllus bimaculatus]|nr:DNA repair protein complementing XP-A cells homolog [Gryllus bimaculatus]
MNSGENDCLSLDEALEFEDELNRENNTSEVNDRQSKCASSAVNKSSSSENDVANEFLSQEEVLEFENDMILDTEKTPEKKELTLAQKARIERNRQRAKMIRQGKLIAHPYAKIDMSPEKTVMKVTSTKLIDTGGGFLLEENESEKKIDARTITELPGPILNPGQPTCLECQENFPDSYLYRSFDHSVCDSCRDHEDKHSLIPKTDAKSQYLLQDCDLEKREPPLKFVLKKNPHNRFGNMKLYLHLQVEKRALEVWGSEEALAEEHERREEKRSVAKIKKYNKQLKSLRMNVRSSLYDRTTKATHEHEFGPDSYNADDDTYTHSCKTCGFEETFEKL